LKSLAGRWFLRFQVVAVLWIASCRGRGFHRGTLIEYLAEVGSGAVALSLIAAREACREGGALVLMDRENVFHPPAAANLGVDLANVVFVRPRTRNDYLWALNQSLSCQGVGAVVCWPDKLDSRAFRQLQLAAESCGTTGLFLRPPSVRGHPVWSELQLFVETLPAASQHRRLRVEIVRCRNGNPGASVEVELDDETGTLQESRALCVASAMGATASAHQPSGA
jgi:protein ImuA